MRASFPIAFDGGTGTCQEKWANGIAAAAAQGVDGDLVVVLYTLKSVLYDTAFPEFHGHDADAVDARSRQRADRQARGHPGEERDEQRHLADVEPASRQRRPRAAEVSSPSATSVRTSTWMATYSDAQDDRRAVGERCPAPAT